MCGGWQLPLRARGKLNAVVNTYGGTICALHGWLHACPDGARSAAQLAAESVPRSLQPHGLALKPALEFLVAAVIVSPTPGAMEIVSPS